MHSARSDARNLRATPLPAEGYTGEFPMLSEFLPDASDREGLVWAEAWRTPQATQWIRAPWRYRSIAMWVRWSVKMEEPDASAATCAAAQRLADQIGLTPAGLKENGWRIVQADDVPASETSPEKKPTKKKAARPATGGGRRLRSVPDVAG